MSLSVLSMLVYLTGVSFMVFSPKKICFSSSDSQPLFINNRLWKEIGNETFIHPSLWVYSRNKVCTSSYTRHKSLLCVLLLLCGERLVLVEALAFICRTNTTLCAEKILNYRKLNQFGERFEIKSPKISFVYDIQTPGFVITSHR